MKRIATLLSFILLATSCQLASTFDQIARACDGMTLAQLRNQNDLSPTCREAIQDSLSNVNTNFKGKLIAMGSEREAGTNKPLLYTQATAQDGTPLGASDFQNITVKATINGSEVTLAPSDFTISAVGNAVQSLMSISLVNDYSASMRDEDLDLVSGIETDLFNYLPPVYEAEVIQFSEAVTQKIPYTSDKSAILAAVARDDTYKRESTALYDGMGVGLARLATKTRPIRVLFVATDGQENASTAWSKPQLLSILSSQKYLVVMLGTLFSDVSGMKEFAGSNGVYIYAPTYPVLKENIQNYLRTMGQMVRITVDQAYQNAQSFKVTLGQSTGSFAM